MLFLVRSTCFISSFSTFGYSFFLSPQGATGLHGYGTVDLDHLHDFLALTFYPKIPVAGMPIKKLHCFVHSKSETSAIQACATPKDLR
jgi:hypothetical protein